MSSPRPKEICPTGAFAGKMRPECEAEHFHLLSKLRIRKTVPPRPIYTMSWLLVTEAAFIRSSQVTGLPCKGNEGCNFVSVTYEINFSGLP
jgi:hypothetical protein